MNEGRRMLRFVTLTAVALASAHASLAAEDTDLKRGKAVYQENCAACHDPGPGHPGTQMLAVKKGKELAVLIGRTDLGVDLVRAVVRGGLIEMPPFRPSEVSDADIEALVKFIHTKRDEK